MPQEGQQRFAVIFRIPETCEKNGAKIKENRRSGGDERKEEVSSGLGLGLGLGAQCDLQLVEVGAEVDVLDENGVEIGVEQRWVVLELRHHGRDLRGGKMRRKRRRWRRRRRRTGAGARARAGAGA